MPLAVEMEFKDEKSSSKVIAGIKSVSIEPDAPSPCVYENDGQWIFIVDNNELKWLGDDRIQIASPFFEGNSFGSMTIDSQRRKWFCGNIKK